MAVIYPAVSSYAVGTKPVAASFPNNVLVQARGAAAVAGAAVIGSTTKQASATGSVLVSSAGVTTTTKQTAGFGAAAAVSVADVVGARFSSGVSGAVSAPVAFSTPSKGVSATGASAAVTAALTVPSKYLSAAGVTTVTGVGTVSPQRFAQAVDNRVVAGWATSIKPIQVESTGVGVGVLAGRGQLKIFKAMHIVPSQLPIPRSGSRLVHQVAAGHRQGDGKPVKV